MYKTKLLKEHAGPFRNGYYNRSDAQLFLKNTKNEWSCIENVLPAFFIHKLQINNFVKKEFEDIILSESIEGDYYRFNMVPSVNRDKIDEMLNICHDDECYPREADVNPLRRWFSDIGARISTKTNSLFFDIEAQPHPEYPGFTDEAKDKHMILTISSTEYKTKKQKFFVNKTANEEGEYQLLEEFLNYIKKFDTILAWNGEYYDFYVLKVRAKLYKINFDWRKINLLDYMLVVKKCLMSVTDISFKRSYALDNIGQNVLGIPKLHLDIPKTNMIQFFHENRVEELKQYNDRDVEIMVKLEEAREFLELHLAVCSLCKQFPDRNSLYPNMLMDGLMLRLAVLENKHFRSRFKEIEIDEDEEKFAGAYVMDPEVGFHKSVQVIDFSSLYPSIMVTWNLSPETKKWETRKYPSYATWCTASATNIQFRTDFEGMLPKALNFLLNKRKEYSQKQKNAEVGSTSWKRYGHDSTAIKVIGNSMYGLLGSRYSRYYDRELAETVTLTAQHLIKSCIQYVRQEGYKAIASDTDSVFIKANENDTRVLIKKINDIVIPKITNESKCRTSIVKMDFDKGYRYLLIQAKKRYVGKLSLHKGRPAPDDMEPDVKGLEFQRSEQIRYAQKLQLKFIHKLINPECNPIEVEKELRKEADDFMTKNITIDEIEISQSLSKHPNDYPVETPHVRVAKKMIEEGEEFFVGQKIQYFIIKKEREKIFPLHSSKFDGNFDRKYYWITKILPPIVRTINARFPDFQFHDLHTLEKNPNQHSLLFFNESEDYEDIMPTKTLPPVIKEKKLKVKKQIIIKIDEDNSIPKIKAISKLCEVNKGKYKLTFFINMKKRKGKNVKEVEIPTDSKVSKSLIKDVKTLFPDLDIIVKG